MGAIAFGKLKVQANPDKTLVVVKGEAKDRHEPEAERAVTARCGKCSKKIGRDTPYHRIGEHHYHAACTRAI